MKRFTIIAALLLAAAGCKGPDVEEVLLHRSDISLTWKGDVQVSYNPATCQMSFNDGSNTYRIYTDKLSEWFMVSCSENPVSQGQTLTADVSWTGPRSIKTFNGVEFKVEKTDGSGLVWLWSSTHTIGIIIRNM